MEPLDHIPVAFVEGGDPQVRLHRPEHVLAAFEERTQFGLVFLDALSGGDNIGDVPEDATQGDGLAVLRAQGGVPFYGDLPAITRREDNAELSRLLRAEQALEVVPECGRVVGVYNIPDRQFTRLLFGIAQCCAPRPVHIVEAPFRGEALDQIGGVLEEVAVTLFARAQGFLVLLHPRDVARHTHGTAQAAPFVEEPRSG